MLADLWDGDRIVRKSRGPDMRRDGREAIREILTKTVILPGYPIMPEGAARLRAQVSSVRTRNHIGDITESCGLAT